MGLPISRSARGALLRLVAAAGLACLLGTAGVSAAEPIPHNLPDRIVDLLTGPPRAEPVVDPNRRYVLLVHKHELLRRERLTEPAVAIAGRKLNPRTHSAHAPLDYYALSLVDLESGRQTQLSLPPGVTVGYPRWAPDGSRFAFTVTTDSSTALWVGNPAEASVRKLVSSVNASYGQPCIWMPNSRDVLCQRVATQGPDLSQPLTLMQEPWSPQEVDPAQMFTQPASLSTRLIEHLLESRLEIIDTASTHRRSVGAPAAVRSVDVAPDSSYLIVTRTAKPYPGVRGAEDETKIVEIWDKQGQVVATLPRTRRAVQWHASEPATLVWVEREDGLDRVMTQALPTVEPPHVLFQTPHAFAGLEWTEDSQSALVTEYDARERTTRVWHAQPGRTPLLLGRRSIDSYAHDFGLPVMKTNRWGKTVVAVHGDAIYTTGSEPSEQGQRRYLARLGLDGRTEQRLWEHVGPGYEVVVDLLADDASVLLTRREATGRAPNYFVTNESLQTSQQITNNAARAVALGDIERHRLRFQRDDGVSLSATLYVPAGHESAEPLPLVVWAYPREVGAAAPAPGGPQAERYLGFDRAFKLFFLLSGYAVLDDVSMPIVGADGLGNDSFIEQVVSNAQAALQAAASTGLVDPRRAAIAGHSYGAFTVANLLAHSRLFSAGAALSGAYNRTLTPFGFQTERRTLWEAPETYLAMSPFLFSNRIDAPLLLVHGTLDQNAGTPPIQSTRFYEAIRGTGGQAELLLLPGEGHAYRTRESVLETAGAMLEWFDRYLKAPAATQSPEGSPQLAGPPVVAPRLPPIELPRFE